ncbi:MAG: hypothetical protein V2B18_06505 [Pseudomonadota bacterium]
MRSTTDGLDCYRTVDFDCENRPEVIRVVEEGKEREVCMVNDTTKVVEV